MGAADMNLKRVLVANRGEIALRIVRAARALRIESVLAASAADRDSMAARTADRVVLLGPAPARDSYLNADLLVHAAKATGCDALHPGYGFLSERAALANLCAREGITFVGPTAESIERVGGKIAGRQLATSVGVPVIQGSEAVGSVDAALKSATQIGYPVVTKASAGGGGRGMVVARDPGSLRSGFEKASLEAKEAFGDGTLFLEHYVDHARHIEVQMMGDGMGGVLHFGERDCSVQRRYQKMVEEAPAAILDDRVRTELRAAAVRLLSAIEYRNAGTVEFLYDVDRQAFSFIEVNARIQVEHPVSEMICGVDLVQLQLRVAGGEPLPFKQSEIAPRGHAIEVRILAEDPARGFAPSPGRITRWTPPTGACVRVDSAMHEGAMVPPFYDSMIAKLIVFAEARPAAIERLSAALAAFQIEGIATNLTLLKFIVDHPDFRQNKVTTRWLEQTLLPAYAKQTG
jgi:acetyl-CoA carboxylase, biotin carboxylase subunit